MTLKKIQRLIGKIEDERDKAVLSYRYALTDNIRHSLRDTGKVFRLSHGRIKQIEDKYLK